MPVVPPLDTGRYFSYQEVADYMGAVKQAVPHLVSLFTIGSSYEGRPLLLAEVTNRSTREGLEKPAIWLDGNLHASDLLGSMACLDVLRELAAGHGRDEFITDLLDNCTFYIVPRLSPDGAERCLSTGDVVLSGTRPYPFEDVLVGLIPADVDGDGRVRQMRIEDPLGEWRLSKRDPRLLVRRSPDDREGPFYRLYREGYLEGSSHRPVQVAGNRFGLDFDRNFPAGWVAESEQAGAGPFPLSESETRAVADFFRTHPNLFCAISCRSHGGFVTRPFSRVTDDGLDPTDLMLYRILGKRVEEITGCPVLRAGEVEESSGSLQDWTHGQMGMLSFSPRLWSPARAAGLDVADPVRFLRRRTETESLAILRWADRELEGRGFLGWKPYEHPQLGFVELGGWDLLTTWFNPPPGNYLREHLERYTRMVLALAAAGPRLAVGKLQEETVGWSEAPKQEPLRKVVLEVENRGYLSTWVTRSALSGGRIPPLELALEMQEGTRLVLGEDYLRLGQLSGTGTVHTAGQDAMLFEGVSEGQRRRVEWLFQGSGEIAFRLRHDRAGFLKASSRMQTAQAAAGAPPPPPVPTMRPPTVLTPPPSVFPARAGGEPQQGAFPARQTPPAGNYPLAAPSPRPAPPPASPPPQPQSPQALPQSPAGGQPSAVPRQEQPAPGQRGPFPGRPAGRVFGSPPSRPGPSVTPRPPADYLAGEQSPEIKPVPLARSESDFEPLTPPTSSAPKRSMPQPAEPPPSEGPPDVDFPDAPPPRVSRIPAPLLLRRQRGKDQS